MGGVTLQEKILIVDDEKSILDVLTYTLNKEGYLVDRAYDGEEALKKVEDFNPQIIILDLMLPLINGYDVCRKLEGKNIGVIMLTAKNDIVDKVLGLELGADDYLTKPFSVRELIARVKAILRRTKIQQVDKTFSFGNIIIDFPKHEVIKATEKVELTLKEFELLEILIRNRGRVMTRDFLLDKIWGYEYVGETRTVDVHIRHLRQKIEEDDKNPRFVETVRGIGYRFNLGE